MSRSESDPHISPPGFLAPKGRYNAAGGGGWLWSILLYVLRGVVAEPSFITEEGIRLFWAEIVRQLEQLGYNFGHFLNHQVKYFWLLSQVFGYLANAW